MSDSAPHGYVPDGMRKVHDSQQTNEDAALTMFNESMKDFDSMTSEEKYKAHEKLLKLQYLSKQYEALPNNVYRLDTNHPHYPASADIDDLSDLVLFTGEIPIPEPQRFTVEHYIPEGHSTIIAGHGGVGKSYQLMHMAVCISMGMPFMGLSTVKSNVLLVDFEMKEIDFNRRLLRVLNGMGFNGNLPSQITYWNPGADMLSANVGAPIYKRLKRRVDLLGAGVVMVDSLTAACADDVKEATDMAKVMRFLGMSAKTVIALDHVPHTSKGSKEASPFGSVMKTNLARSVLTLSKDQDTDTCFLRQTKQNETAKGKGVDYKMVFSLEKDLPGADYSWNCVRFETLNPDMVDTCYHVRQIAENYFNTNREWPTLKDIHHAASDMGLTWATKGEQTARRYVNDRSINNGEPVEGHKGLYIKKVGVAYRYGTADMLANTPESSLHL